CEDVTEKDVKRAVAEGFDSIELAKRYTTVTMGPCQGKLCQLGSVRLLARETSTGEGAIGATTARAPWEPVERGLLAGRHYAPLRAATASRCGAPRFTSGTRRRAPRWCGRARGGVHSTTAIQPPRCVPSTERSVSSMSRPWGS